MRASSSSRKCCGTALTVATVPTGMKTGVSTSAWGKERVARRAKPSVLWIVKVWDTRSIVSPRRRSTQACGGEAQAPPALQSFSVGGRGLSELPGEAERHDREDRVRLGVMVELHLLRR